MEISHVTKGAVLFLRITMGWLLTYMGISAFKNSAWSLHATFANSTTLPHIYDWLASAKIIPIFDAAIPWILIIVGIAVIIGFYLRFFTTIGMVVMVLLYLPTLHFPFTSDGGYLVNHYVIYFIVLLLLSAIHAGSFLGIDKKIIVKVE